MEDRTFVDTLNSFYLLNKVQILPGCDLGILSALMTCLREPDMIPFTNALYTAARPYASKPVLEWSDWGQCILELNKVCEKFNKTCYGDVVAAVIDYMDKRERKNDGNNSQ